MLKDVIVGKVGFWKKLTKPCVLMKDYSALVKEAEGEISTLSVKGRKLEEELSELKVVNLRFETKNNTLTLTIDELKKDLLEKEKELSIFADKIKTEKNAHEVTLLLLKDAQESLVRYTTFAEDSVPTEAVEETEPEVVAAPIENLFKDDVIKVDPIEDFCRGLNDKDKKSLVSGIEEAYAADKRISKTLSNWKKKFPSIDVHVVKMFTTALTKERGEKMKVWYDRYKSFKN